jgi:F-type H+-transporting ATPase subunit delta
LAKTGNIAERYATSLFLLAGDKGLYDAVAADLKVLVTMTEGSPDLQTIIYSPVISRADQVKGITALASKASLTDLTRKFLGALATNRRLNVLTEVATIYNAKLAAQRGEHTAVVTSAAPLRPGQLESLREKLASKLGGRVTLDLKVDPEIIGGLIVKIGSRMIDSSIRSKLERIGFAMKGTV